MSKSSKIIKIKYNRNNIFHVVKDSNETKIRNLIQEWDLSYINSIASTWNTNIIEEKWDLKWLREPQVWGVYSVFSHWSYSNQPATIVMPTWTWKTETMLTITIKNKSNKTLVIVPTNSLREQIGNKFIHLWKLEELWIIDSSCLKPIVWILEHKFKTKDEALEFFQRCNIVISTINIVWQQDELIQAAISSVCSNLIIDEAHHIAAKTWMEFRKYFLEKQILQFTATPFRRWRESVDWKIIYNYPLRKAQENGYFSKINFTPVNEFIDSEGDTRISETAISILESDLQNWYDHIVMVRCEKQEKAEYIYENYYKKYTKYNPILIHSWLKKSEQVSRLEILKSKRTNIVVCVDMLWEWYDLPNLKIAAMHDDFKSLWITLQFIWRFTRPFPNSIKDNIWEATLISNIYNKDFENELSNLYAENSDWNYLISNKSKSAIEKEIKLKEFIENFDDSDFNELWVSIQNITPSYSAYFFKQQKKVSSKDIIDSIEHTFRRKDYIFKPNIKDGIYLVLTKEYSNPQWWRIKQLKELKYNIYVISYDEIEWIIAIHSDEWYTALKLTEKIWNNRLIAWEEPYKAFQWLKRLALSTVWLKDEIPWHISFRMYAWSDMEEALDRISKWKSKSNVFWYGYEEWNQTSLWVSTKWKIWARLKGNILEWSNWVLFIWHKLNAKEIKVNQILKNSVKKVLIEKIPQKPLLWIEWYEELIFENITFIFWSGEEHISIENIGIQLEKYWECEDLTFFIQNEFYRVKIQLEVNKEGYKYILLEWDDLKIKKWDKLYTNVVDFLNDNPPTFIFINNSSLVNNYFLEFENNKETGSLNLIPTDWIGKWVDIKVESQWKTKKKNSIQYHMIQELKKNEENIVIFDDDSAWEIADIVVISEKNRELSFHLYHCKYSGDSIPWGRIWDLYEVCWQAQKSIKWFSRYRDLIERLKYRESIRNIDWWLSRFERWNMEILDVLKKKVEKLSSRLFINIIQPWVLDTKISKDQIEILNATNNYLLDTFKIKLWIHISKEPDEKDRADIKKEKNKKS